MWAHQDKKTYKHPTQNFSFETSGNWEHNTFHKDEMIYEMINEENKHFMNEILLSLELQKP